MCADHHVSFLEDSSCSNQLAFDGVAYILWSSWRILSWISLLPRKTTTNFGPLDVFLYNKKAISDIKISDHLMAVNIGCHFNALGNSYQQKVSTLEPWQSSPFRISIFKYCMVALDAFSSSQYLRVYSLVKTWNIYTYAICDA
ncbi:hypothetical protein K492DRAFT_48591 [Lichtheimia hyalospora FSU 10163]|nr:hypothetical protein K492DRAFT_48591 [Lichtheimia hyalospora FSU 10163]